MSSQETLSEHASGLSALMDGEASAADIKALCEAWGQDDKARRDWHLYQLIGDTLRSDELAQVPSHDSQFISRLSARLALEPTVLAPQPPSAVASEPVGAQARRSRWATPMTVAAGFLLVAGVLLVLQNNGVWEQDGGIRQFVQANTSGKAGPGPTGAMGVAVEAHTPDVVMASSGTNSRRAEDAKASPPLSYAANGQLVRDARIDRYLQAHREFGTGTALGLSTGYLRNASFDALQP